MIKLLKKSLLPFGGTLLLASASFAQVDEYVNDSFAEWVDYGNANPGLCELTNIGSNGEHEWEFRTEDPDGTPNNSIWTRGYLFRTVYTSDWYQLSDYQIIPTNEEPVVFSYRFYDLMDREEGVASQLRNFTELGDVTVEGDTATANALFAFGVWDGSNTHYQIRNYPADNWVMTDVERTVGWHEVKWVFLKDTFNLFFDDEPVFISRPYRGMSKGFTRISLASGYANRFESMIYDDVYLAQGADFAPDMFIDKQPADDFFSTGAVSEFGGTASFSVETTGGIEPFTYQWYHDGELLVNDDRISGANTDTLIIEGTKGSDSGEYYVTVSDSGANFVQSSVVKLLA